MGLTENPPEALVGRDIGECEYPLLILVNIDIGNGKGG
jgi:hypothetical protein